MQAISIHQFTTKYRLPASAADERRRLDGALADVVDWALEEALERHGLSIKETLCIRNLYAVVNLKLSATDRALARAWGDVLAQSIKRALGGAHVSGIAVYRSRLQALMDFAAGVSLEDLQRVWAWKQVGLWSSGRVTTGAET